MKYLIYLRKILLEIQEKPSIKEIEKIKIEPALMKPPIQITERFITKNKNKEIIDALTKKLERLALSRKNEKSILPISQTEDTSGYNTDQSEDMRHELWSTLQKFSS